MRWLLAVFAMDEATYQSLNPTYAIAGQSGLEHHNLVYGEVSGVERVSWQYKFANRGILELQKGFLGAIPLVK